MPTDKSVSKFVREILNQDPSLVHELQQRKTAQREIAKKTAIKHLKNYQFKKGHKHSQEVKLKISNALKGRKNPEHSKKMKGKVAWNKGLIKENDLRVKNYGNKISKFMKGKSWEERFGIKKANELKEKQSKRYKKLWKNEKYRDRTVHKVLKGLSMRPTNPEKTLISLFEKNTLPYKYVGNGDFILKGKNPDFLNVNGQKKVIELFGDYWHSDKVKLPFHRTKEGTIEHYDKYGFDCLVIWENELDDINSVLNKIQEFDNI